MRSALNRRGARIGRGGGRRGGSVLPQRAVGIEGFVSGANYLRSAVGQILPGDVNGFYSSIAIYVASVPVSSSYILDAGWSSSARGHGFVTSTAAIPFRVFNGAGASVLSPTTSITAGDVGETIVLVGVYDATGALVRIYRAGVEVGSGTAVVGYTPDTAGSRLALMSSAAGLTATTWARIVGAVYGTGIPSAADILAHYAACKSQGGMALMPGTVTNVNRWQAYQNVPAATSWADDISGMVLTKTGTLASVPFTPVWERASYGVEGFVTSTNTEISAAGQFLAGSVSGFYCAVAVHILSVPTATGYAIHSGVAGVGGHRLQTSNVGWVTHTISNGVGASIASPISTIVAGDVGKVVIFVGVYDSTAGKTRLYRAGVEVGSGNAIVGYTPASGTNVTSIGSDTAGTQGCPWARILGASYGTGIPTAANILDHYNMVKATGFMLPMPNVTNVNLWNAETNVPNAATWTDSIGGMVLTKTGTLTTTGFPPVFE